MKRVVDTGIGIGETSGPFRGGDLRRKREGSHTNGDVQGHQPKCHPPNPACPRSVRVSAGDHISAVGSATDSGGAPHSPTASQKESGAMPSATIAVRATSTTPGSDAA